MTAVQYCRFRFLLCRTAVVEIGRNTECDAAGVMEIQFPSEYVLVHVIGLGRRLQDARWRLLTTLREGAARISNTQSVAMASHNLQSH